MGDPFYANWFATLSYSPRVSATSNLTISWKQNLNIQNERPHCKEIETLWLNYKYTIRFFQPSWVGTRIPCRPTKYKIYVENKTFKQMQKQIQKYYSQPSWIGTRIPCRATRWRHRRERLVETTTRQVDIISMFFLFPQTFFIGLQNNMFRFLPCSQLI